MTHIAFITLFLGLTLGPQRIELNVTGPAHHVEIQMDGRPVAALSREPWTVTVDLGPHLLPHRLVARALDVEDNELARAEQTVNLPRSPAEVQMVLDRDAAGVPSSVQILWQSLEADKPRDVRLTLDGKPLTVDEHFRAAIPEVDIQRPHLLQVRAIAPRGLVVQTEAAFGGGLETSSGRQLTAVPIRLIGAQASPSLSDLGQWLQVGGAPARVVAIEEFAGDVLIIRHPLNLEAAIRLDAGRTLMRAQSVAVPDDSVIHHPLPVARFVWPIADRTAVKTPTELMPYTNGFEFKSATALRSLIVSVNYGRTAPHLRYADAVAVAGLRAMGIRHPRAVVLILGGSVRDDSRLRPSQVREYLNAIGVPLFVWALSGVDEIREWGSITVIPTVSAFDLAYASLRDALQSQRIVWIDGDYLPGEITVAESGKPAIEVLAGK